MLKRIKHIFITLGIASGMTTGALIYKHNIDTCRLMVIEHERKHQEFSATMAGYEVPMTFHQALGGK
jgi:hypothetical protein